MGLLDSISPTPRNKVLGLLSDLFGSVDAYANKPQPGMPMGKANPVLGLLSDAFGIGGTARTLDRLSYGEPITNIGKANVPLIPQDTADAAGVAAAALPLLSRGALKASDVAVQAITKNPQATATRVADYAAQMNPANPMVVWHGSPHKFDKFDSSKIGTGEGAQAYGHGMYFAESPETAMTYQPRDPAFEAALMKKSEVSQRIGNYPAAQVYEDYLLHKTPAEIDQLIADAGYTGADLAKAKAAHEFAKKQYFAQKSGALYKVDLPDEAIAKMLDWDKPLSQQAPEVQKALKNVVGDIINGGFELSRAPRNVRNAFDSSAIKAAEAELSAKYGATKTAGGWVDKSGRPIPQSSVDAMLAKIGGKGYDNAGQLYNDLSHIVGSQADISAVLRNNGVPGIRYLDGGSRGNGAGTSNFVVFPGEEGLLSILERNGISAR